MKARALIAEFIGTFALIFVGVMAIYQVADLKGNGGLLAVALAHGLAIGCLASATAAISGGHLNPAVTFGMMVTRKIGIGPGIAYIIAQLLGGYVAAQAVVFCLGPEGLRAVVAGTPALGSGITMTQGLVMEGITTFFLMFVIFGTAVDARAPKVGALFIGLTVALDILAVGPQTGGAMNPARWFGPAMAGTTLAANPLVWTLGPLAGAALAALIYSLFLEEKNPLPEHAEVRTN